MNKNKIVITIRNQNYILDFANKKLLYENEEVVKGALELYRIYVEQESIEKPKDKNNHSHIAAIKKHFQKKKKLFSHSKKEEKELVSKEIIQIHFVEGPEINLGNCSILIPCSSKKSESYVERDFKINELSFHNELGAKRKELLELIGSKTVMGIRKEKKREIQNNINNKHTCEAHLLYSEGKILKKADCKKWGESEKNKTYILSALFGLIKATDFLPFYDLSMNDTIDRKSIKQFWKKSGVLDVVLEKLNNQGVYLIDLLSDNYKGSIGGSHKNLIDLKKKWKDRGEEKGIWINSFFENNSNLETNK